eukprot:c705_g1_i1.p1 GENE.c705_g1_i1~~c705_g1_i1.p1  ORF type:complete len:524 (+),score=140.20 c705_g1_i1:1-1572(+)
MGSHGGKGIWTLDTGHYEDRGDMGKSLKEQVQMVKSTEERKQEEAKAQFLDVDPQTQLMLKFLQDLNLSKYNRVFLKQEVDWNTLLKCNDQDLIDIGVKAIGPRKKILKRLAQLNATDLIDPNTLVTKMGNKTKPLLFAGRFELVNTEASKQGGSAAAIRFARDIRTNREVVVKLVQDTDQWEREIKYLRALRSPEQYVVELIDYEEREQRKLRKQMKKQQTLLTGGQVDEDDEEDDGPADLAKTASQINLRSQSVTANEIEAELKKEPKDQFVPGTDIPLWDFYEPFVPVGYHWMVLEKGRMTLRDFFQETGVVYETQRKAILERVLMILAHLAERRIVHVDIKPENLVFFGEEMRLKLIDFGNSCRTGDLLSPVATPSYCSPEMAKAWVSSKAGDLKKVKASPAMDIWAVGMVLFESYLGYPVMAGREDTYGVLASDEDWMAGLPWGVIDNAQALHLLKKLLAKSAKKRPGAAEILKCPYLTWGLDTVEVNATFGALQQNCEALKKQLEEVENDANALKKV